ncbi:UNVERIFIED_CONTAM: hypothetical protein FKN15_066546 [Acipenser sinensis]
MLQQSRDRSCVVLRRYTSESLAGDACYLCTVSSLLLLDQESVRKGVSGLIEIMKEDYNETVHKKAEVIQMCNFCSQTLEKIEKLEIMKEDYNETVHKKAEVIQMCNFCSQTLEKIEKLVERIKVLLNLITAIYLQFKKDKAERLTGVVATENLSNDIQWDETTSVFESEHLGGNDTRTLISTNLGLPNVTLDKVVNDRY